MRAWTEARATPCSTCRCGVGAAVEGPENVAPWLGASRQRVLKWQSRAGNQAWTWRQGG